MLVGVTDCGTSWKWGCRGRLALGFKPRRGSHAGSFWEHVAWAEKNHETPISFSEIHYPRLGRGGRKDCEFVGMLKDFGISMKTLSYYS